MGNLAPLDDDRFFRQRQRDFGTLFHQNQGRAAPSRNICEMARPTSSTTIGAKPSSGSSSSNKTTSFDRLRWHGFSGLVRRSVLPQV